MATVTITKEGRKGNTLTLSGTVSCTAAGEAVSIVGGAQVAQDITNGSATVTAARLLYFSAFNTSGEESPNIRLNTKSSPTADPQVAGNGFIYMSHGGSDSDVFNFEATLV